MSRYIRIGLDVHVDSITAAIHEGDQESPDVLRMSGDMIKVRRLFRRMAKKGSVRECYEASGAQA
jgi:hypothetical protein